MFLNKSSPNHHPDDSDVPMFLPRKKKLKTKKQNKQNKTKRKKRGDPLRF